MRFQGKWSNEEIPTKVGIEATGPMQWFVNFMEELAIECLVGHPAEIRAMSVGKKS